LWLVLAVVTSIPYALAELLPPPGQAFQGAFFFIDDHYLYLSYVQQAEQGAFFFHNKLVTEDHEPGLVNLEWWAVGRFSAVLGGRPFLAYRLFGLAAALLLLSTLDAWLRSLGLSGRHRLPALVLVSLGGGLGGLLYAGGLLPVRRALDLGSGLFPFVGLLANPHFTAGTALLLAALRALQDDTRRGRVTGIALGSLLGLVRPYDFVLLPAIHGLAVCGSRPPSAWLKGLLPLAGLAPVVGFSYWAYYTNPAFSFYAQAPYLFPRLSDLVLALGPALLLAALGALRGPAGPGGRPTRAQTLAWVLVAAAIAVLRPVPYSFQFLVGAGLPLLALGALGLAHRPPRAMWTAAALLGSSALVATALVVRPLPYWFTPAGRMQAALDLRRGCEAGDVVLAPPDIGLYAAGLSACRAWVSHVSHPEFAARSQAVTAFYGGMAPAERLRLLDRACARHLLLPGAGPEEPSAWLGPGSGFRRTALVGSPPAQIAVYSRDRRPACRQPRALLSPETHP
jgi:hypothetical protein